MPLDREQLLTKSRAELDALFTASAPGALPEGEGTGTAIVSPGSCGWVRWIAWLVRCFCWQGKVFHSREGWLINRVSPFGCRAIKAKVYRGQSWLDQKDVIVIDYAQTSLVAKMVRDEIREVAPGLYLGKVWFGKTRLIDFIVSFQYEPARPAGRRVWATGALLLAWGVTYLAGRFTRDVPVVFPGAEEHFKYGSTGGERDAGIPLALWRILPDLFPGYLPGQGYASIGFIFETNREFPIGISQRNVQGIDRVFLNCAACHTGTVRDAPDSGPRIVVGMPANGMNLQAFERFIFACARDENFNAQRLVDEIAQRQGDDWLNRLLFRFVAVDLARQRLISLSQRFSFMEREPDPGPGRVDTFNPPKTLLNFPMDKLSPDEWVGNCDLPSIWNQAKRKGMWLHWDGNNNSVEERNRSAAFGTGAIPTTLDRPSIKRMEEFINTNMPPPWPYQINRAQADRGEKLYAEYCAKCHGRSGTDFAGELVGQVTPVENIRTDRHRLDSYTSELCANQNLLYAGYPEERFAHFRKTFGYANQPLDGLWLRGPYLHNGSVATLRELLEPAAKRRAEFFRGYDVIDRARVGFVSDVAAEKSRKFFKFDTRLPGNSNSGHEGKEYGTDLSADEKDALVEHLKSF